MKQKKPMQSIRDKISKPFIILITLAYVTTFILFNSVLIVYKNDSDSNELLRVSTAINSILNFPDTRLNQNLELPPRGMTEGSNPNSHVEEIKGLMWNSIESKKNELREEWQDLDKGENIRQELQQDGGNPRRIGLVDNDIDDQRIQEAAESLEIILITTSIAELSDNIVFAVLNENDEVVISNAIYGNMIENEISEMLENGNFIEMINEADEGEIESIGHIFNRKYFTYNELNSWLKDYKIVYISTSNFGTDIMIAMDIVLFALSIITIVTARLLGRVISKTIAKPLESLSDGASQIGKGNYIFLQKDESSRETYLLTKQINNMSASLKKYDEAQRKLLQNASHELRTPLMSIQGYAEGVENGIFKDPKTIASHISEESKRMNRLVEGLLTLSHIDNDEYGKNIEVVNLSDMAKEYLQRIQGLAVKNEKTVDLIIKNENIPVLIDEDLMAQVFVNIIGNGLRYGKTKVVVTVDLDYNEGEENAIIIFKDDGEGVPENELPFIFDRFYRGKKGNHGLGLAIVKSVVEYMKGEICAYNEDGQGAVFKITIPIVK